MTKYNPVEDRFVNFEAVNVEPVKRELKMELYDDPFDIGSLGFSGINKKNGNHIVSDELTNKMIVNNPEHTEIQYNQPLQQSVTQNSSLTENKKKAMDFFYNKLLEKNKGKENVESLSYIQAAGIVGNLIHESNLNTTIKGDKGKALGLAQWHPDRQKGLKTLAQSKGVDLSDFDTQLEYIWEELNTTERKALNNLLNSTDVEHSTMAFMRDYERPGNPHFESRLKYARSLLS